LDSSIAQLISKLEVNVKIDSRSGKQLNDDNLQLTAFKRLLEVLFKENPITIESLGAQDNYGEKPDGYKVNQGLVRQLISNLNQPKLFANLIGLNVSDGDGDTKEITVTTNSFLGAILKMLYPSLPNADSKTAYSTTDLSDADDSFTADITRAGLDLLASLLRGRNYTYLIQPIVTDEKAWKIDSITNEYFDQSGGILRSERLVFTFDPTGIKLGDGSIVPEGHVAKYTIFAYRDDKIDHFTISRISKVDLNKKKKTEDKKA